MEVSTQKAVLGVIFVLFCSIPAHSEGFRIPGLSADAMSRAEAVVASVDDTSAVWYNPAALTKSGKMDLSFNLNNTFIPGKYTGSAGLEEKSDRTYFPLFGIYAASSLGTKNLAVGLGINTPFGLGTNYSKASSFRYITTGGDIALININPTVAYQIHPAFSMGAGLDYYYSMAELRKQYPWQAVAASVGISGTFTDGSVTVQGNGDGVGFNVGFLLQPAPEHSVGITYRSQVVVKYSGKNAELTNIPLPLQGMFSNSSVYTTGAKTSIRYPDMVAFGYAYHPSKKWLWEVGAHWTNWDDVRSVNIDLDRPNALFPNSSTKLDWKNSFTIRTGAVYQWTDHFSISGGFFTDQSPTNEATYSPLVPDGDHQAFSIGFKYAYQNFTFSLPIVGMIQTRTGSVDTPVTDDFGLGSRVNGNYRLFVIQLGFGINYRF